MVVRAFGARSQDREKDLEIARGDLLRIGTLLWERRLFNGTVVEVKDITVHEGGTEGERVEIQARSEYGEDVSFFVDELVDFHGKVRLDHGYAMTIASSQGRTVDAAFVLADDRAPRPTIYPAVTRHREHMRLYVNRAPLAEAVREKRSEDLVGTPVNDREIVAHLAVAVGARGPEGGGERLHRGGSPPSRRRQGRRRLGGRQRQRGWRAAARRSGDSRSVGSLAVRRAGVGCRRRNSGSRGGIPRPGRTAGCRRGRGR